MSEIYKVNDLAEALQLARKFQKSGKYNLFRGQAQNWKVLPAAGRLSKKKFEESRKKLERLFYYINTEPSLKKYCAEIDSFFAIAQHYGIATNYIDFTTNVDIAFYFATNSKSNKSIENCAIICLNEIDFKEFVETTKILYENDQVIPPYISRIEVENLWRLQAQNGCFLFTPYVQIEHLYDFDKIIFPFTTSFDGILKKDVYPLRKSELEILLDHYFNYEERIIGSKRMMKFAKDFNIPVTKFPSPGNTKILQKKEVHKSWHSYEYRKWKFSLTEKWQNSESEKTVTIFLCLKDNQVEHLKDLRDNLTEEFNQKNIIRSSPLKFEICAKPKLSIKVENIIKRSCLRIWDGTRNLPYSIEEIISIIGQYIHLEIVNNNLTTTNSINDNERITITMINKYGSSTRCDVSKENLAIAFRDDINNIVISEMARPIPSELLLHINKPRYIFDFKKLLDLFKTELVAHQVLTNSRNNNPVIFYTPSQLKALGYA